MNDTPDPLPETKWEKIPLARPTVVVLCGSSRWPDLRHRVMMDETLAGKIVIPMGVYGHADYPPGAKAATNDGDESTAVKRMLDLLHLHKIDLADEILVIVNQNHLGESTLKEIQYAGVLGKRVRYWRNPDDQTSKECGPPTQPGWNWVQDSDNNWAAILCDVWDGRLAVLLPQPNTSCRSWWKWVDELEAPLKWGGALPLPEVVNLHGQP